MTPCSWRRRRTDEQVGTEQERQNGAREKLMTICRGGGTVLMLKKKKMTMEKEKRLP